MNVERILALADIIEGMEHGGLNDKTGFNMDRGENECSIESIAAQSCHADEIDEFGAESCVAVFLGIKGFQSSNLCYPSGISDWNKITPAQAATTLRNLAKTGVVDWSHVNEAQS